MDNTSLSDQTPAEIVERLFNSGVPQTPSVREDERRRYVRMYFPHAAKLVLGKGLKKQKLAIIGKDISRTGLCLQIKTNKLLPVGTKLRIKLPRSIHKKGILGTSKGRLVWATLIRSWRVDAENWVYAVRFNELLEDERTEWSAKFRKVASAILVVVAISVIFITKMHDIKWFWYSPLYRIYGLLGGFFFLSRAALSIIYREPEDKGYLPSVTIIISVKNEEAHIAETVKRVFDVRYPMSKLELIVIDDGSTDKTWAALQKVQPSYPHLRLFQFPKNLGKRHGMALGAQEASGDILVYVDSDSYVDKEGIYRIVQPFFDKNVGAVAGHTQVIVEDHNIISKMESVRYYISHQLFKTAESVFGTVTCCPGAFSAYRRDVVLRVLPKWLNQTFMGVQSTFGDDRSLTNFVLRTHRVLYHASAICVTYVPDTWKKFFTQQLRWKKSWAREATIAARILRKKHPFATLSFYVGIIVTLLSPFVFFRAMIVAPLIYSEPCLPYLIGVFLTYLFICLFFYFQTGEKHWPYGILFAISYLSILCWQTFWAIATVNKTQWGTR